jgi:hypothetical protein
MGFLVGAIVLALRLERLDSLWDGCTMCRMPSDLHPLCSYRDRKAIISYCGNSLTRQGIVASFNQSSFYPSSTAHLLMHHQGLE